MINLSSAMGAQFAEDAAQFTKEIQELGPSPLRGSVVLNEPATET